jgi:nicotinamide-nucleotide adenylyltransferase
MYFIFRLCKGKGGWELLPKKNLKLNLEKLAEKFEHVEVKTKVILTLEIDGVKASIYPSGRVLLYDVDENKGREIAKKVFKTISGEAEKIKIKRRTGRGCALFVGRFQPFHFGHLKVIKDILKENGKIVIVIGSSQERNTLKNPFSSQERKEMLRLVLDGAKINNFEIVEIPDFNSDEKWTEHIRKLAKFDVVYSRNPWTLRCFRKAKIPVKRHKLYERYKHCGTKIRNRILKRKHWEDLVPKEVFEYIKKIKGEERIRNLASK